jgi:hypothetical protein
MAIVAIIAVVAIVILVMNSMQNPSVEEVSMEEISELETELGQLSDEELDQIIETVEAEGTDSLVGQGYSWYRYKKYSKPIVLTSAYKVRSKKGLGVICKKNKECKSGNCDKGICKMMSVQKVNYALVVTGPCGKGKSWKPECNKNACLDKETNTFVFGEVKKSNSWLQVYYWTKKANECAKLIQKPQAQICDDWNYPGIVCRD